MDSFVPIGDGIKLHVRHRPGGGARPFLMLHGLGSNARLWDEVADRLCAAGHPVYAVDMRGHGESDSPEGGYDHATVVADLVAACAAIGLTDAVLVGHSWGGNIALRLSVEHPALVCALAMIDSGIDPKTVGGTWEQYASIVERQWPDTTAGTVESMRDFLRARHPSWSPTLIEASLADMRVNPDGSLSQRLSTEQFLSLMRSMWDDPPSRWYPEVRVPVMLLNAIPNVTVGWQAIWGTYIERWVGAAAEAMPQAESRWYHGVDHNMHAEQPDRVADDLLDLARGAGPPAMAASCPAAPATPGAEPGRTWQLSPLGHLLSPDSGELVTDLFAAYGQIREESRLACATMSGVDPFRMVARHEDVTMVLSDPRFVVNPANVPGMETTVNRMDQGQLASGIPAEYVEYTRSNLTALDGAEHLRIRKLLSLVFTVRRVTELRPRIEEITAELLDRLPGLAQDGVVDLLKHFAYPMPYTVICELIGIPEQDRARLRIATLEWSIASDATRSSDRRLFRESAFDYVRDLIGRRRAEPRDDLCSALIRAHDEGDQLSDKELVWTILSLIFAGQDTTVHFIANGVAALLTHPDQLALLREQPDLMPQAVNELLRWCGPALAAPFRHATQDVEIGGELVRKGEAIMPVLVGANYDPRAFSDPERLDITRHYGSSHKSHVGLGYGLHYCLGAALARREAEVAFEALLRRFPDLSLAVDAKDLERAPVGMWKLMSLPVRIAPLHRGNGG